VEGARHTCKRHNTDRPNGTDGSQAVAVCTHRRTEAVPACGHGRAHGHESGVWYVAQAREGASAAKDTDGCRWREGKWMAALVKRERNRDSGNDGQRSAIEELKTIDGDYCDGYYGWKGVKRGSFSTEDAACMRRGQGPWPGGGGAAARWTHDASGRAATDSGTHGRQCSGDER
jgi:hypothetical protein